MPKVMGTVLWLLAVVLAGPALAQAHGEVLPNAAVARDAISQLRSPYCPGLMLEVCPSPQAEVLRDSIRELAAAGEPADEIVEWMLARHGEEWRALPKRSGGGLWAWIIPPVVLLGGAAVVARRLRSRQPEPAAATYEPPALSGAERERLAAAMAHWEENEEGDDI